MKSLKWIILSIVVINILLYAIDFIRYSDYDEKKRIARVKGDTLILSELKIEPDASYMLLEVKITDKTQIEGLGPKAFLINNADDLKHGQKVMIWYNTNSDNENIAQKVVVYNFFDFH